MMNARNEVLKRFGSKEALFPHVREVAILLGAYLVYMVGRLIIHATAGDTSVTHAISVIKFEKALDIFWEPHLQRWSLQAGAGFVRAFNYLYIATYWPVILTVGFVMYIFDRKRYYYYRKLILSSFVIALVIFELFPLAPPRMMTSSGLQDMIGLFGPKWYGSEQAAGFYNDVAAMPSLHFAWTVVYGFMFWSMGKWWLKVIGILYPTVMFFTIVITGNHYVIDALAGAVLMLFVYLIHEQVWRKERRARFAAFMLRRSARQPDAPAT
ncbi:MAG: phosphatase PAP2 family protein [Chloroflexi bacterium]|nr:phosphatase PAP2 family protein [Chloroflexota bacterium]